MTLSEDQIRIIENYPLNDLLTGELWYSKSSAKLYDLKASDESWRSDIATLLLKIADSTAAFHLPATNGNGTVPIQLLTIYVEVRKGTSLQLAQFRPLMDAVIANSPDIDIWAAVFNLIANVNPLTPPPSIPPTFSGTPIETSSSRLANSETRDIVEGELFEEIKNCTFRNVGGFWDKFFDPKSWYKEQNAMLKGILTAHNGNKWTDFPTIPNEKPVWDWLCSLEEHFLDNAPYKLHTTRTANQFKEQKGQMDLFLQKPATKAGSTFLYKNVLVVGMQKKSYNTSKFKADFFQLARDVRKLWIFDRSGAYSSGPFNIHDEPDKFARALVSYTTIDNDTIGLDTFVERQDKHRYVTLDNAGGEATRIRLDKAIIRRNTIVSRGTTCYETQNGYVAKFSWASGKRKLEVEKLNRAEAMGVEGVAKVVAHRRITSIAEMRKGLQFLPSTAHRFQTEEVHFDDLLKKANTNSLITIPSSKRKSLSDHTPDNASRSKRRRSNSQESTPASLSRQLVELLESGKDAIKAHRSLYVKGKILHRDISSNNIIITKPEMANSFKGMLIDLDLAKVRNTDPSRARHQIGTLRFMAIEVLYNIDHTYLHDLESFFYVLLWMCARQSWWNGFSGEQKPPKPVKVGDMGSVTGLEIILTEFPKALDVVKPLCFRIREILFPLNKDGRLNVGTPTGDPDQLYRPIIAAYDEAISRL
ncbi:serine/threonine-protein kinase Sgk2 [Xylaria telfairii]|nr:serine/threonine-protein kinase Sgk2 [Xylaria telfairii]